MSYTSEEAMAYAFQPSFYLEEHAVPIYDYAYTPPKLLFAAWLARGYMDLTEFWEACEEETSVCTIADYTPSDFDGSYIVVHYDWFDYDDYDDCAMLCFADKVCIANVEEYDYMTPLSYLITGDYSATNPDTDTEFEDDINYLGDVDDETLFGFSYPEYVGRSDDNPDVDYRGREYVSYWFLQADDTYWTIGGEIDIWTNFWYYYDSEGIVPNRMLTITFDGASTLALAGSAALAAAILF